VLRFARDRQRPLPAVRPVVRAARTEDSQTSRRTLFWRAYSWPTEQGSCVSPTWKVRTGTSEDGGDVHAHAVPGNRCRMATPGNAPQASAGGVTPAEAGRLEIPIPAPRGYLSFPKLGQVSVVAPTATGRGGFGPLVLITQAARRCCLQGTGGWARCPAAAPGRTSAQWSFAEGAAPRMATRQVRLA
jgi:hypothetical protein